MLPKNPDLVDYALFGAKIAAVLTAAWATSFLYVTVRHGM